MSKRVVAIASASPKRRRSPRRVCSSSRGISAGSFCRSPSIGTRISPRARSSAADRAAVWPQLRASRITRTCSGSRALDRFELCRRAVGRAVIDKDQLVTKARRPRSTASSSRMQRLDVVDLVEDRNQHGKIDSRCDSRPIPGGAVLPAVRRLAPTMLLATRPDTEARYRLLILSESSRDSIEPSNARSSTSMAT